MRTINLLPPEQAQKAKKRKGTVGLILFMFLWLVVLGAGAWFLNNQLQGVEDDVAAQRRINQGLQAEIASLSEANEIKTAYDQTAQRISSVLVADINWGSLLNDVGRVIPDDVWLVSLAASRSVPDPAAPGGAVFGAVTMTGVAFSYPDASTWIRTLDSAEWDAVGGAWVSNVTLQESEGISLVRFASSASITDGALSNRTQDRIPVIEE